MKEKMNETASGKSKMTYFLEGKTNWTIGKRTKYMNELTRNQVSTIFKARTRMIKVKGNYKNGNKTLECRICKKAEETQTHVLEECEKINEQENKVTKEMIFNEEPEELKITARKIDKRMEILESNKSTDL